MDGFGTLNGQLINSNSPVIKNDFIDGLNFDLMTDRNIISHTKLRNFSFNAGTGGTIVLGGTNNGNGVLLIKDTGGTTRVTANNTGITITNGNITILNTAGGTVVDGSGLVSVTSFPNAYIFSNIAGTTTSTSYVAVPGATLGPFVLVRNTNVLVFISAYANNLDFANNGNYMRIQGSDSVNGVLFSNPAFETYALQNINFAGSQWSTFETDQPVSVQVISTLSAGTHTLKLNFEAVGGGTAVMSDFSFGYVILGN